MIPLVHLSGHTLLIVVLLLLPAGAHASGDTADSGDFTFLPAGQLYLPYLADPHQVGFGVQWLNFVNVAIPQSGNNRVALKAGGRFGIAGGGASELSAASWQIDLLGGFNAQFDADHSLDNIGWDGWYGMLVTTGEPRATSFKLGVIHDSSHVGDEYMERTGRTRIGYTRHELAAGVSHALARQWRLYAEGAWGFLLGNEELMQPGRAQAGVEFESCRRLNGRCTGWFAALDLSAMEERDWHRDLAAATGLIVRSSGRTWRFGIEWYRGRPPIGEFFQYTESYLSLGVWLDV